MHRLREFISLFLADIHGNPFAKLPTHVPAPAQTWRVAAIRHMLSIQKQKMSEQPIPPCSSPPPSGFGKVLNSLQGLQQRLDDFSVEDVSKAHSQAVELIQQLGQLEAHLQRLRVLHRLFRTASTAIDMTGRTDQTVFDSDTDGLEGHPHLRAIVRAGKFIEMHPHVLDTGRETDPKDRGFSKTEPAAVQRLNIVGDLPQSVTESQSASGEYDFATLKLDDASVQVSESENRTGACESETSVAVGAFDERLLKALIEAYGEFATVDKTITRTSALPTARDRKSNPIAEPKETEHTSKEHSTALMLPPKPHVVNANVAHERPSSIAEKESLARKSSQSAQKAASRGELDEQLKNIIKDYGEVDLYSQRKSVDTKIHMIAAVAATLLIVALAGFFLFKTSSSKWSSANGPSTRAASSAASVNDAAQQK